LRKQLAGVQLPTVPSNSNTVLCTLGINHYSQGAPWECSCPDRFLAMSMD